MKCKMTGVCDSMQQKFDKIKDLPPLLIRLVLAYKFWESGITKWNNLDNIAAWFDGMGYPFPTLSAYLAAYTELLGALLLLLGFATRLISIPLMIIMVVAILTVHLSGGFETALYFLLMLFGLFVNGPGRISLSGLIKKYNKK